MMKLSKAQSEILRMMATGWELGLSMTMDGGFWIQKGGLGRGGDSQNVHHGTAGALENRGLIERCEYSFPTQRLRLTEAGRIEGMKEVER